MAVVDNADSEVVPELGVPLGFTTMSANHVLVIKCALYLLRSHIRWSDGFGRRGRQVDQSGRRHFDSLIRQSRDGKDE